MLPVVVIGAGPAGLATAVELHRRRIPYRLLERGPTLGHAWENTYDSLRLHTGKHMSALPGMPFARGTSLFPTRAEFLAYLRAYATRFDLRVETGREATRAGREPDGWVVQIAGEAIAARAVVVATGIMSSPRLPSVPGRETYRGTVLHSVEYRRPAPFVGQRVLVVGVGNSSGEIASELAQAGATVTVLVRSGANVVPREILGVPIQYIAYGLRSLPRPVRLRIADLVAAMEERRRGPPVLPRADVSPLDAVLLIGFHLVDAIRAGLVAVRLGGLAAFTPAGVRFTDGGEEAFDTVLLATGFTAALGPLGSLVQRDPMGFAARTDRVTSADQPDLYFVGHNYDATGGLANIRTDAGLVAAGIARG